MIFCRHKFRVLVMATVFITSIAVTEALNALKGTTVQLACIYKVKVGSSQRLQWRKSATTILSENTIIANTDVKDRLKITGDHSIGQYNLNISDIRQIDQATYDCSITGTTKGEEHKLTVIDGPTKITIENVVTNNTIPGIEGQDMTIKCTAVGGQPPPDIKLVISGSTYTGKQSAHHTFIPNSSYDGSTVICQAGYTDINHYPLTTTAYIYLKLKPNVPHLTTDTLTTEEAKSFDVTCQSTGSRPAASMYWLLGQERTNITSNSSIQSIHDSSADTNKVTSNLKYSVDRNNNGQKLICGAVNVAGSMESSLTLNVEYAPTVTVENKDFSQTQSSREIQSTLYGNPAVITCKWIHTSKHGEIVREFIETKQILTLPTVSKDKRYQDTGKYTCTAENGIVGINGQLKQTGSGYVTSNAPPVITADNKDNFTQYGKFGKSTELKVNVYSIPKHSSISWYRGNTNLQSKKFVTKEEKAMVKDVFHGVEVQLDGYRVTLTISELQEADFTNYTLRIYYASQYVEHIVILESASAPETPSNFTITGSGETSITFQWIPGYDGGQTQTFYVEYRIGGTTTWMFEEIKADSYYFYTLSGLQDKTLYELRMYAKNRFNQSQHTDIERKTTLRKEITALGGVIGGVAGGLVALIAILAVIAFVLFRRKKDRCFSNKRTRSESVSEVQEGLKDNVLYEGSESEGLKVNILYQSAGPDSIDKGPNAEYAEVSKPPKKPSKSSSDECAEVQKQNDVYAEVDKKAQQKNVKKKKQKDKKKPPKSRKTNDGALNNNPDGEYANSGIPMGNMSDGAYLNAENRSARNKKNDQGLEYADLTFGSHISKGKQPIIHGDENRTIYSDVDHTKKAPPPPPQESEYEETNIRHGKKK